MIINSNSLYIPLKDRSVQICVTSPPYYGLRDYGESNQIGLEETPEAYVEKLVQVFREVWRVLKDDGTLWLNLGDSYAGSGKGGQSKEKRSENWQPSYANKGMLYGLKPKDLIGIPWMASFALRADGWYLRSDIIWHKPNPMPESVKDRPTKAHEYIFLLSKSQRYYYDADAIAEPSVTNDLRRPYGSPGANALDPRGKQGEGKLRSKANSFIRGNDSPMVPGQGYAQHREERDESDYDVNTRNKRSVWTVSTKPYRGAHFAVFPPDLIEPCILAGTSERGQCPACGAPWVRVVESRRIRRDELSKDDPRYRPNQYHGAYENINGKGDAGYRESTTVGWEPSCGCDAGDPVPQIVLDPFSGSGTTGQVAIQYRRQYVGLELNMDYIELSKKRMTTDVMLPGIL